MPVPAAITWLLRKAAAGSDIPSRGGNTSREHEAPEAIRGLTFVQGCKSCRPHNRPNWEAACAQRGLARVLFLAVGDAHAGAHVAVDTIGSDRIAQTVLRQRLHARDRLGQI